MIGTVSFAATRLNSGLSKERAIGNRNQKSAKKIEEQKEKRLATTKRGKLEKRQDRRDSKHD
ncbi:MAG: hypothetical protein C0483_12970 [Pirellula sp.]|nr:hypothetical protein [Pirellula sp.]